MILRFLSIELVFVPRDHYVGHRWCLSFRKVLSTNAPRQLNAPSASSHHSSLCHVLTFVVRHVLIMLLMVRSGKSYLSRRSSGCLPAVPAHTTAPLPRRWAQGQRMGSAPWAGAGAAPSVLGCRGCPFSLLPRVSSQVSALLLSHHPFLGFTFKNKRYLAVQPFFS